MLRGALLILPLLAATGLSSKPILNETVGINVCAEVITACPQVIGIDLGTTFSCVAVYKNGRVEIITNDQVDSQPASVISCTFPGPARHAVICCL